MSKSTYICYIPKKKESSSKLSRPKDLKKHRRQLKLMIVELSPWWKPHRYYLSYTSATTASSDYPQGTIYRQYLQNTEIYTRKIQINEHNHKSEEKYTFWGGTVPLSYYFYFAMYMFCNVLIPQVFVCVCISVSMTYQVVGIGHQFEKSRVVVAWGRTTWERWMKKKENTFLQFDIVKLITSHKHVMTLHNPILGISWYWVLSNHFCQY